MSGTDGGPGTTSGPLLDRSDEMLLAGLATGQLDALDTLYDRYRTMAYGIARRITGDDTLAEDVVQEAFLDAWRGAHRYLPNRGSPRTWLLSIVHHRAIDAIRRRRPVVELPAMEDGVRTPDALTLPDVWGEVSGRLDQSTVAAALATLPEAQREAVELAYFAGLTQAEIAERTGAPLGTVKGRVRLALLALRRELALDTPEGVP